MGNPWAPPDDSTPAQGTAPGAAPQQEAPQQEAPRQEAPRQEAPQQGVHPAPPHPAPPHPAPPHPAPTPPDPAGVLRATRAAAWSAAALLASVLLVGAPWPGMLAAPVTAVAGLVLAVVAIVRAARARARGTAVALPVVLLVASLAWVGISAQTLLYVDASRAYAACQASALTEQAERRCAAQLQDDMRDRLESVLGRAGIPMPSPAP